MITDQTLPVIIDEMPHSFREYFNRKRMYLKAIFHRKFKKVVKRLSPIIPPETIVLDIGGNHGRFAAELSRIHNRKLTVHSFEPVAYNFEIMKFIAQGHQNMFVHHFGLSDRNEAVHIYTPIINGSIDHGGSFISNTPLVRVDKTCSTVLRTLINVYKGDEVLDNLAIDYFSFAKIDVEGYELPVLRGLRKRIEKYYPLLFTEILPPHPGCHNTTADLILWMQSLGYQPVLDDEKTHRWRFIEWDDVSSCVRYKGQDILLWHKNGPNGDRMRELLMCK